MTPGDVSAVVVTRGDVDLTRILQTFTDAGIFDFVVWDNSRRPEDLMVYGRYAAITECEKPVIFVQDDDVVIPPESIRQIIACYSPGRVTCNMPERFRPHYPESALVGFGACFDRWLPRFVLGKLPLEADELLLRECDQAFTALLPRVLIDVDVELLPHGEDPSRLWRQPEHHAARRQMLDLALRVRDAA